MGNWGWGPGRSPVQVRVRQDHLFISSVCSSRFRFRIWHLHLVSAWKSMYVLFKASRETWICIRICYVWIAAFFNLEHEKWTGFELLGYNIILKSHAKFSMYAYHCLFWTNMLNGCFKLYFFVSCVSMVHCEKFCNECVWSFVISLLV